MSTVPVFSPDGVLGDIPEDQLVAAVKAGAKPGVNFISPDGKPGVIPADRVAEASQVPGAKILPFEQQEVKHPGLWAGLGQDLLGVVKNIPSMLPPVQAYHNLQKGIEEYHSLSSTGQTTEQVQSAEQAKQGYGWWYRNLATPTAEGIGANVSGMEQSAREGDIGGVIGHALAVPTVMLATEGAARVLPVATPPAIRGAGKTYNAVRTAGQAIAPAAGIVEGAIRLAHGDTSGALISAMGGGVVRDTLKTLPRAPESITNYGRPAPTYPGAPLPAAPPAEVMQARGLAQGAQPAVEPSASLGNIPVRDAVETAPADIQPQGPRAIERTPQPVSGESALLDILSSHDNATLLKIAKSRGINVAQEATLKPGVANSRLVGKIIGDFSPDELQEIGSKYMETTRFQHHFGDITPEAWRTISLGYYFPDVKIPTTALRRSQASISSQHSIVQASNDLTSILQQSLAAAKRK